MSQQTQVITVKAQFQEMFNWLQRGWRPAPAGRSCPECGGPVWLKTFHKGQVERHSCVYCAWQREYTVR